MVKELSEITLDLSHIESELSLIINERTGNTLFETEDAEENGEARYQLRDGCFYDYELSNSEYFLGDPFDNMFSLKKGFYILAG